MNTNVTNNNTKQKQTEKQTTQHDKTTNNKKQTKCKNSEIAKQRKLMINKTKKQQNKTNTKTNIE